MTPPPASPPESRAGLAAWIVLGLCSGGGMALAAWLLIAPDISPPSDIPFKDKIFHFVAFGCLTGPAVLAIGRRLLPFWLTHMLALAAGIEVVQALGHQGRSASIVDFLAGGLGIAVAAWVALAIRGFVLRKGSRIAA